MTVYRLPDDPSWWDHAACAGRDPQIWHPPAPGSRQPWIYNTARTICARCPVNNECLATAMVNAETHGMWGGTSPRERRRLRRTAVVDYPCRLCLARIRHQASARGSKYCYDCGRRQRARVLSRSRFAS